MRAGNVLAVKRDCEIVVVDSGDLWFVYVHIIPSTGLRPGQGVGTGSSLGTVSPNQYPADHPGPCGLVSDAAHSHLAVAQPQGGNSAAYVTLQDRYLCCHRVIKVNNDDRNIIVEGLTHEIMHPFRVPQCWAATASLPAPPSTISVIMTSGGAGIGVNWVDHSTNEEGFNIAYSPTQEVVSAKHALVEANQTFLGSDWGLAYTNWLLAAGQTICFQVTAYNATGGSAPTAWGCITVP